jgi:hypothetical protein
MLCYVRMRSLLICLASFELLSVTGCNQAHHPLEDKKAAMSGYDLAIKSGLQNSPDPKAFKELFPNSFHVISYYTGAVGEPAWTSETGLYNRYVFRMFLPITLDHARTNIVAAGVPAFDLYEIQSIKANPNGTFSGQSHFLSRPSVDDWHRLIQAKGNFAAISINLESNKPLEGFEHALSLY